MEGPNRSYFRGMKGREIERLARKHLLLMLPGFVARGSLAYRRPFDYFLHGLSSNPNAAWMGPAGTQPGDGSRRPRPVAALPDPRSGREVQPRLRRIFQRAKTSRSSAHRSARRTRVRT